MKNYMWKYTIEQRGGVEANKEEWLDGFANHCEYITNFLAPALRAAKCGWDDLQYKVIKYPSGAIEPYMVLCVNGRPERWIPIDGNSDGCNLEVLGQNIW